MKNLQKINDLAVKGGWTWTYHPTNFDSASFSHYLTPLLDTSFWEAVCIALDKNPEYAKEMLNTFVGMLFETDSVDEALGKLKLN